MAENSKYDILRGYCVLLRVCVSVHACAKHCVQNYGLIILLLLSEIYTFPMQILSNTSAVYINILET